MSKAINQKIKLLKPIV